MNKEKVECKLCGKEYSILTYAHMKKSHNTTLDQYKLRFPNEPLSSEAFKIRQKYVHSKAFKNSEEEKIILSEESKDDEIEILDEDANPTIEEIPDELEKLIEEAQEQDEIKYDELNNEKDLIIPFKLKKQIVDFIQSFFPKAVENYRIIKTSQYLTDYVYITDIADPTQKIDFEFPNTFWHNKDIVPDSVRDKKLEEDGWLIIKFDVLGADINAIKDKLKSLSLI